MNTDDYSLVLDSFDSVGIYVVREDNHEILYCNKKVKEMIPNAREGMICHELWQGSCQCCPLIGIEGKRVNHSFNYDGPNHKATDITAVRVMWSGEIPAFVVSFTPHAEAYNSIYEKVVKANLTTNACEAIKMADEERALLPAHGFTLRMALDSFAEGGFLYEEDVDRFLQFSDIPTMSREFKSGKTHLVCVYRRRTKKGVRWNAMEVVPDKEYTDDNQVIMVYVKDVHDIYREGLEHEALNLKNEAILKALGGENFDVFFVNLETGNAECIRSGDNDNLIASGVVGNWDDVADKLLKRHYRPECYDKFRTGFGIAALRKLRDENGEKRELLFEREINGIWRFVSITAYRHEDAAGKGYAIIALQDVDNYIRKEMELMRDEKRMATVIRSGYSMMNVLNIENGICERIRLKESGEEVSAFGDYNEYIMRAADTVVHPEDRAVFLKTLGLDAVREKAAKVKEHREEVFRYRIVGKTSDRWVEQHIFYMSGDARTDVAILGRDVTEEKQREEEEIQIVREKVHIINSLNIMFLSIGYIDLKRNLLRRAVQRGDMAAVLSDVHNYTDVISEYADKVVNPEDRASYLETVSRDAIIKKLSAENPVMACEFRENSDGDEEPRWLRVSIVLAESDGSAPAVALYVAQDITESKRKEDSDKKALRDALEAANFANMSKSEFLSRMSHDIRTPMNAIIGMTAIAGAHLDDKERVADCLGKITISGRHLLTLINEILDLSKIESGRVDLAEEEFALSTFFDELIAPIMPSIQAKKQSFKLRMDDIEHDKVVGDSLRLQQVFMNILSNAIKYTPENGKIEVEVQEKPSTLGGYGHYEFMFRDNGIGMSEEYAKHIFEPFTRDESTRTGGVEGTGLGMAIARNIVQMMNGDINVQSKPNVGSEFTVALFLKLCDAEESDIRELAELPVLVADDDEDSCVTTCHVLDEMGMRSEYVVSGKEAIVKVEDAYSRGENYFAVILDWKMPEMDGIETAKRIRAVVGPEVPIIILSAYDWGEVEEEARAAGINGFISKPLFRSRLVYLFKQFTNNAAESSSAAESLTNVGNHNHSGKRILLAEDNDLNREIATEIIGMTGVDIDCAINGREAEQMFAKSPEGYYDLIFMDIRMPVVDGHEATRTIRAMHRSDAATIPIIAMSANAFASDISASRLAGMNEHIIKPLNFADLMRCMDRWLGEPEEN